MKVEWGRAHRGRVWHLVNGPVMMCRESLLPAEVTEGQPPIGALVCGGCADKAFELVQAVEAAVRASRQDVPVAEHTPEQVDVPVQGE